MSREFDPLTLRLFVAVCEEGNIARAAARESLVASAVSKRIGAMESAIGAPLLVRGRRGVAPTAAGEALLRRAREILGTIERMRDELAEFASGVQGSVRVMASVSALAGKLPEDIASFLARYRSVRVSLDEGFSSAVVRAVREGSADVGVLWDVSDLAGLQAVPYRSDRLCAVVHAGHPLAGLRSVSFDRTLDHPSIAVTPGGVIGVVLRRQAALLGRSLAPRIQVSGLDAARRIAAAGLGLAILPDEATAHYARAEGLKAIPLSDGWARRQFVVCSRPEPALSASTRLLVDHLKRQASRG